MPVIKIHLDDEEYDPIRRLADRLHLKPEDVAYAGLNQLMLQALGDETLDAIADAAETRRECLPRWSDSARSVHAYEGRSDDHSSPRF